MIIEIDEEVANDQETHRFLDRILAKVEDGWHLWRVLGTEEFANTTWVTNRGTRGDEIVELFEASVERTMWQGKAGLHRRRVRVTASPSSDDEAAAEEACRILEEPYVILVENRFGDGDFIKRVIQELDKALFSLFGKPGEPLRVDSVGGKGQMKRVVKERSKPGETPRLAVVVDSDRRGPGESPSEDARRLARRCRKSGVPCWVLAKREAENYLPHALLELRPNCGEDHFRRVRAWDALSDDQKDYYDMKDGLSAMPSEAERELFESLSIEEERVLRQGFGDGIGACWSQHRGAVRRDLERRGRGDLEAGIELIKGGV